MLVDEAVITVKGGRGGDGLVSFFPGRKSGPDGGDGGHGGDVYAVVNASMSDLNKYIQIKEYKGLNGEKGQSFRRDGKHGKDIYLELPVGTTIVDTESGDKVELTGDQQVLLVRGGRGGRGNTKFTTSTYQAPHKAEQGEEGQVRIFKLVMRYIAHYGLIGLPNAGKSSLLNELTAAKAKIANYPFTTLEPNLGVINGKVIADIPGLIEGASQGKGLGIKFLKHIEKVELLFHCISVDSPDLEKDYLVIRQELASFNPELTQKEEILLLTKIDLITPQQLKEKIKALEKLDKKIMPISIHDWDSLQALKKLMKVKKSSP